MKRTHRIVLAAKIPLERRKITNVPLPAAKDSPKTTVKRSRVQCVSDSSEGEEEEEENVPKINQISSDQSSFQSSSLRSSKPSNGSRPSAGSIPEVLLSHDSLSTVSNLHRDAPTAPVNQDQTAPQYTPPSSSTLSESSTPSAGPIPNVPPSQNSLVTESSPHPNVSIAPISTDQSAPSSSSTPANSSTPSAKPTPTVVPPLNALSAKSSPHQHSPIAPVSTDQSALSSSSTRANSSTPSVEPTPTALHPLNSLSSKSSPHQNSPITLISHDQSTPSSSSALSKSSTPSASTLHVITPTTPITPIIRDQSINSSCRSSSNDSRRSARRCLLENSIVNRDGMENFLKSSNNGRIILKYHEDNNRLDNDKRNLLAKLLMVEELREDPSKFVSSERFELLSETINKLFPQEIELEFYTPFYRESNGKGHPCKGKLYEQFRKLRKKYRAEGLILGRRRTSASDVSVNGSSSSATVTPEIEEHNFYLKNNSDPWDLILQYWANTLQCRQDAFEGNENISEYFKVYPPLSKPEGYTLIDLDFRTLYPDKANALFKNWPRVEPKILDLAESRANRPLFASVLKSLKIDLTLTDPVSRTANALFLLSALLPSITIRAGWKPSRIENKTGFIIHSPTLEEAEELFEIRNQKLNARQYTDQPAVLLVGELPEITPYVRVNKIYYHCETLLKAVDIAFKIFKTLGTQFPQDSLLNWLFLDQYLYKFESNSHMKYVSLGSLANDLSV